MSRFYAKKAWATNMISVPVDRRQAFDVVELMPAMQQVVDGSSLEVSATVPS